MTVDAVLDLERRERIGLTEAILCPGKTTKQITDICASVNTDRQPLLLTRLSPEAFEALPEDLRASLDYDDLSATAVLGKLPPAKGPARIAIVTAGTSDLEAAREAARTLACYGEAVTEIADVGVAGLWRILKRVDDLRAHPVVIVVAGMDGALPSVVGGLVSSAVIAVPKSTGYGAARKGETALRSALSSCAPGVLVVNIDNGYGAACAALRILGARARTA